MTIRELYEWAKENNELDTDVYHKVSIPGYYEIHFEDVEGVTVQTEKVYGKEEKIVLLHSVGA